MSEKLFRQFLGRRTLKAIQGTGGIEISTSSDNETLIINSTVGAGVSIGDGSEITSGTTSAQVNQLLLVNVTMNSVTIDPPGSPAQGDVFAVSDSRGNASVNNITINFIGAGQNFHGSVDNYVITHDHGFAEFSYINATIGWIIIT